ncbi:MAG: hypothetical protein LBL67_04735, partial [Coriobacteriales bacterium]|nr:hypothetical protein [Coriobacteriales bacterium]
MRVLKKAIAVLLSLMMAWMLAAVGTAYFSSATGATKQAYAANEGPKGGPDSGNSEGDALYKYMNTNSDSEYNYLLKENSGLKGNIVPRKDLDNIWPGLGTVSPVSASSYIASDKDYPGLNTYTMDTSTESYDFDFSNDNSDTTDSSIEVTNFGQYMKGETKNWENYLWPLSEQEYWALMHNSGSDAGLKVGATPAYLPTYWTTLGQQTGAYWLRTGFWNNIAKTSTSTDAQVAYAMKVNAHYGTIDLSNDANAAKVGHARPAMLLKDSDLSSYLSSSTVTSLKNNAKNAYGLTSSGSPVTVANATTVTIGGVDWAIVGMDGWGIGQQSIGDYSASRGSAMGTSAIGSQGSASGYVANTTTLFQMTFNTEFNGAIDSSTSGVIGTTPFSDDNSYYVDAVYPGGGTGDYTPSTYGSFKVESYYNSTTNLKQPTDEGEFGLFANDDSSAPSGTSTTTAPTYTATISSGGVADFGDSTVAVDDAGYEVWYKPSDSSTWYDTKVSSATDMSPDGGITYVPTYQVSYNSTKDTTDSDPTTAYVVNHAPHTLATNNYKADGFNPDGWAAGQTEDSVGYAGVSTADQYSSGQSWTPDGADLSLLANWTATTPTTADVTVDLHLDGNSYTTDTKSYCVTTTATATTATASATASGGSVTFDNLPDGDTYYIWEGASPSGGTNTGVSFTLSSTGTVSSITGSAATSGNPIVSYYTINTAVSPANSGTVSAPTSGGVHLQGTSVTLSATAASNYNFQDWTAAQGTPATDISSDISSATSATAASFTVPISGSGQITVTANFSHGKANVEVDLHLDGSSYTADTKNYSLATSTTNPTAVATGTASNGKVTFSSLDDGTYYIYEGASPATGVNTGVSFTVTDGTVTNISGSAASSTDTVPIVSYYTINTAVSPANSGTVSDPTSGGVHLQGTSVALSATAANGYTFDDWTAAQGTAATDLSSDISSPTSATAASFAVPISGNGQITVTANFTVATPTSVEIDTVYGSSKTLTKPTPNAGYFLISDETAEAGDIGT